MAVVGEVKRMYFREKKSVREIVRLTSLSRNTVRKWLKTPVPEEPRYRRSEAAGKLTPFVEAIKQALKVDAHRARHERRTARALHAQIKSEGYAGSYSRVTDFVRAWPGGRRHRHHTAGLRLRMRRVHQHGEDPPDHDRRHPQQQTCLFGEPAVADAACGGKLLLPAVAQRLGDIQHRGSIGHVDLQQLVAEGHLAGVRRLDVDQGFKQGTGRALGQVHHRPALVVPSTTVQQAAATRQVSVVADPPEDQAKYPWSISCSQLSTAA